MFALASGARHTLDLQRETVADSGAVTHDFVTDQHGVYSTTMFTQEAVRTVERHCAERLEADGRPQPLFLYLAYTACHTPTQVPAAYTGEWPGLSFRARSNAREKMEQLFSACELTESALPGVNSGVGTPLRQEYAGMMTAADEGIRNVTDAFKRHRLWDNTLVLILSGPCLLLPRRKKSPRGENRLLTTFGDRQIMAR